MPRGTKAYVKNGWLPRSTHGRRVHSIGAFTKGRTKTGSRTGAGTASSRNRDRTYRIVVLSHDNPTMKYGVRTIERVARAVHRALTKGRAAGQELTPENEISEVADGSAPAGPPTRGPTRTGHGQPVKIGHERVSGRRKLS
ncbi:MAG: hypothetical protein WCD21_25880 [Streptomyces sp.]